MSHARSPERIERPLAEIETADVTDRGYPTRWGTPPGLFSTERTAWVQGNARVEQVRNLEPPSWPHGCCARAARPPRDARLALEAATALALS